MKPNEQLKTELEIKATREKRLETLFEKKKNLNNMWTIGYWKGLIDEQNRLIKLLDYLESNYPEIELSLFI